MLISLWLPGRYLVPRDGCAARKRLILPRSIAQGPSHWDRAKTSDAILSIIPAFLASGSPISVRKWSDKRRGIAPIRCAKDRDQWLRYPERYTGGRASGEGRGLSHSEIWAIKHV